MSRSDREMLELAAKAAEIEHGSDRLECGLSITENGRHRSLPQWSPLTDDGDEARLEAVLGLDVTWDHAKQIVIVGMPSISCWEPYGSDKQAARRRAGVRAAAKIGALK